MNKQPKVSTLNNFASAWNRLIKTEIDSLLTYMETWCEGGRVGIANEMRLLLRD
jgi:hypothetical protein